MLRGLLRSHQQGGTRGHSTQGKGSPSTQGDATWYKAPDMAAISRAQRHLAGRSRCIDSVSVMGWTNRHLHRFVAGGVIYAPPDPESLVDHEDEEKALLETVLKNPKDLMTYACDSATAWCTTSCRRPSQHRLPGHVPPGPRGEAGVPGAEDAGGAWGCADSRAAIAGPDDPQHDPMREWAGEPFDPEEFGPRTSPPSSTADGCRRSRRSKKTRGVSPSAVTPSFAATLMVTCQSTGAWATECGQSNRACGTGAQRFLSRVPPPPRALPPSP